MHEQGQSVRLTSTPALSLLLTLTHSPALTGQGSPVTLDSVPTPALTPASLSPQPRPHTQARIIEQRGRIREDPIQELAALQILSAPGHLHVQRLLECLQDATDVYAISPFYAGGELFSYLETRGAGLPEDQARGYFMQLVSGLDYLQEKRMTHRDLSLENILLDANQVRVDGEEEIGRSEGPHQGCDCAGHPLLEGCQPL